MKKYLLIATALALSIALYAQQEPDEMVIHGSKHTDYGGTPLNK